MKKVLFSIGTLIVIAISFMNMNGQKKLSNNTTLDNIAVMAMASSEGGIGKLCYYGLGPNFGMTYQCPDCSRLYALEGIGSRGNCSY